MLAIYRTKLNYLQLHKRLLVELFHPSGVLPPSAKLGGELLTTYTDSFTMQQTNQAEPYTHARSP